MATQVSLIRDRGVSRNEVLLPRKLERSRAALTSVRCRHELPRQAAVALAGFSVTRLGRRR